MKPFPQLRVRSEFSFRKTFAPIDRLKEFCESDKTPFAALVDDGTWGHVKWEQALKDTNTVPGYGIEVPVYAEGKIESMPRAWVLFSDLEKCYAVSSTDPRGEEGLAAFEGIGLRFCGPAITNPEVFDLIDLNPASKIATRRAIQLQKRTGKPVVLTSDNSYAFAEDRYAFMSICNGSKVTPQHLLTGEEIARHFKHVPEHLLNAGLDNAIHIAQGLSSRGIVLPRAPTLEFDGDFDSIVKAGIEYRMKAGHIKAWSYEYQERFLKEVQLIKSKKFESYFMMVADLVVWAKEHMLVGPGRGSSAGSLICYLLRITEVDPLAHGLLFERFIDVNRHDLPDIDLDFNDEKRFMVIEYLQEKYGADNVAKIGNVSRLKPRSAIAEVSKRVGIPKEATYAFTNALIERAAGDERYGQSLSDTLDNTDPGQALQTGYPECYPLRQVENHAWHSSVHAAGVIVLNSSDTSVTSLCNVRNGIAQLDKHDAEYLGLLKVDLLGLKTLTVLENTGKIKNDRFYGLELNDLKAFRLINQGRYCGIFQFEGAAQRNISGQVKVDQFNTIDHLTALARPGPLSAGVVADYLAIAKGTKQVRYRHPKLKPFLSDTKGLTLYQEQVMNIVREIGGFNWEDTITIRKVIGKSKGREAFDRFRDQFVEGAEKNDIPKDIALSIWNDICGFGSYGMNRSHTVSYGIISYWTAFTKAHFPLQYAEAFLRSTDDEMRCVEMLRELRDHRFTFHAFSLEHSQEDWTVQNGILFGGFKNIKGVGPYRARQMVTRRNENRLTEKDQELIGGEIQYQELNPTRKKFAMYYIDPQAMNISGQVKEFAQLDDRQSAVVIGKVTRKIRADKNEPHRVARRGGKIHRGQTQFVDLMCLDDSVSVPVRVRINPEQWNVVGAKCADRLTEDKDYVLVRGEYLAEYEMLIATKIKCLTQPDLLT